MLSVPADVFSLAAQSYVYAYLSIVWFVSSGKDVFEAFYKKDLGEEIAGWEECLCRCRKGNAIQTEAR